MLCFNEYKTLNIKSKHYIFVLDRVIKLNERSCEVHQLKRHKLWMDIHGMCIVWNTYPVQIYGKVTQVVVVLCVCWTQRPTESQLLSSSHFQPVTLSSSSFCFPFKSLESCAYVEMFRVLQRRSVAFCVSSISLGIVYLCSVIICPAMLLFHFYRIIWLIFCIRLF